MDGLRAFKEFRRGTGHGWPRLDRIYFSLFVPQSRVTHHVQQKQDGKRLHVLP
jgi:hypothetical protein